MLSLKSGSPIAIIDGNKNHNIYYKDALRETPPDIDTTQEQKIKIFKEYLARLDKLKTSEITELADAYKEGLTDLPDRTKSKMLSSGIDYVDKSLKRYLDFGNDTELFPIITEPSFRMLVVGGSGSGKTFFVGQFLKVNKVKKGAGIFILSPFKEDVSLKLKNLIYIKLETFEQDFDSKKPFEIEDIPKGSVLIFDDIDSIDKRFRKLYFDLRDIAFQRGRHLDISSINISHNPLQGEASKITLRASFYYVVFPKYNIRDSKVLLSGYTGMTKDQIDEVLNTNSRWCLVRKSVPSYFITAHEAGLI